MKNSVKISLLFSVFLMIFGCNFFQNRKNYTSVNALIHDSTRLQNDNFLKAHLKNGDVVLYRGKWDFFDSTNTICGEGIKYNYNREPVEEGFISIDVEDVAILESNAKPKRTPDSGRITALSILTAADVALGIYCLVNPKACFGSCPTFYLDQKSTLHACDAETFSNAIAPSLEYEDVDALHNFKSTSRLFSLTMKNEALETHCIKSLKLLAMSRNENQRVFQSRKNTFYLSEKIFEVSKAKAQEGDVTHALRYADGVERFSLSDPDNLNSKEEIFLEFDIDSVASSSLGLIVNFRQTLMTTYFIYSAMGYMGDQVGDFFAKIETDNAARQHVRNGIYSHLGDIDIFIWNEKIKSWIYQGGFYETGPIAINQQILPLSNDIDEKKVKIKIVQNKGLWRLDFVALTVIIQEAIPDVIMPDSIVYRNRTSPEFLSQINDTNKYLITLPGDVYTLYFDLKTDGYRDVFLAAKGYYLEWMRCNWLKEKNLYKLRRMIFEPEKYLRYEAKVYKIYETTMENEFWKTRIIDRQIP